MIQTQDLPVVPLPDKVEAGKSAFDALKGLSFDDAITTIANGIVQFGFKLLVAALVFYLGKYLIKKIFGFVNRIMISHDVDASLTTFVLSLVRIVLYFILIVTIVGILGIETSSFLALFASAGVAIGMALSGTLQNFAGGVLILLLKPYRVGDYIEAQGFSGTVKEIQIFHTVINTLDNKTIIIPNGGLSTGSINNYSLEDYRRVDWTVGLAYGTDFAEAKKAIIEILLSDDRVVEDLLDDDISKRKAALANVNEDEPECPENEPDCLEQTKKGNWWQRMVRRRKRRQEEIKKNIIDKTTISTPVLTNISRPPFVGLNELADSSIVLIVRAWTHKSNYWDLYFTMYEKFYTELPERGFSFPFPQLDVHIADVPENSNILPAK